MTISKRHHEALEMAIDAFYGAQDVSSHSDMQAAIAAYLKAMGAVIVPSEPTEFMVDCGWDTEELKTPDRIYRDMLAARTNHFTEE